MAETVYGLCALMSVVCAIMLFRGYRATRTQLLLWSSLCFGFVALNNIFLFFDLVVFPDLDLHGPFWRNFLGATAGSLMLFGLIWEVK